MQKLKLFLEYFQDILEQHNAEIWIGGESLDLSNAHIHFRVNGLTPKDVEFINIALDDLPEINARTIQNIRDQI